MSTSTNEDKFYRAKITQRADFGPDLWMLRIQPSGEFKFTAGQYATLGVQGAAKRSERPYSIASSPYELEEEFNFGFVGRRGDGIRTFGTLCRTLHA